VNGYGVGINTLIDNFLKGNPGAGMPPGVQVGYNNGFIIRSTRDPSYVQWNDQSRIPFELRFRGQMQFDYIGYKVDDHTSHNTGVSTAAASSPDFSQFEVKRGRLIMDGSAFDPDLKFRMTFDGNTRGLATLAGGNGFSGAAGAIPGLPGPPGVQGGQPIGLTDNAARIFQAWVSYDFHPWGTQKGCGPDCANGTYSYAATFRPIVGKQQPFFGLEEVLGSANEQFVEFSMADFFFDADDNNMMTGAGFQYQDFDDRLYVQSLVVNANETQIANLLMQRLPAFQFGGWYDFGGSWNQQLNRWDLFGDSISDIDWSPKPVLGTGFATNFVPMDRRSQYTTAALNRIRLMPAAIGSPPVENILNGAGTGTLTPAGASPFALDAVDMYVYDVFAAFKFHGLAIYNEWWMRNLDNFRGIKTAGSATGNPILYTSTIGGKSSVSLFPGGIGTIDFGSAVTIGYFFILKKLELAVRFDFITGESGNLNGNGSFTTTTLPGVGTVRVVNQAFRHFNTAREYAIAVNYYFYRQLVKWQTDISWYQGGNPAAGGETLACFLPGVDGYMVRSQIQLAF
jgi:hypothetical protein